MPNPAFPFLGIHLTRMINGEIEVVQMLYLHLKEKVIKTDFNISDTINALCFKGTIKLFINNWVA